VPAVRAVALLAFLSIVSIAGEARSEEEPALEAANGANDCRALREKNEQELQLYEKRQPPVPYQYPRPNTVVNAPWGDFFRGVGASAGLILSTVIPHVGAQYRGGSPAILLSWPWSVLVIGPMYSCTRKQGTYVVDGHRVHRVMVEPGLNSGSNGTGVHVRGGYRFIWHPTGWPVGPGLGFGSTVELVGNKEPFRYSLSPEAVAHFGNCCAANYFTFAVRYDHYFKGTNLDIIGGSLGYTFF
jgi:hypothetical protein